MNTLHRPKRSIKFHQISRRSTACALQWLLEKAIFPLSGWNTRNPLLKRLQTYSFKYLEEQQGFLYELLELVKHKKVPLEIIYAKLELLLEWHQYLYLNPTLLSAIKKKPPIRSVSKALIMFVDQMKIKPAKLDIWHIIMVFLKKRHPSFIVQLLQPKGINQLSVYQLRTLAEFSYCPLAAFIYFINKAQHLDEQAFLKGFDFISSSSIEFGKSKWFAATLIKFLEEGFPLIEQKLKPYFPKHQVPDYMTYKIAWFNAWKVHFQPELFQLEHRYVPFHYFEQVANLPFKTLVRNLPPLFWWHLHDDDNNKDILLHLMQGKNIRQYPGFGFMNRKMAHLFHTMPPQQCQLMVLNSYCFAYALGCEEALVNQLVNHLPRGFGQTEIAEKYKRWGLPVLKIKDWYPIMQNQQDLTLLLAYVQHCIDETFNWSIKGRTYQSMMRQVEVWMEENRKKKIGDVRYWEGTAYQEWNTFIDEQWFAIFQLTNSIELKKESQQMFHCVYSYDKACYNGRCSIWSLRCKEEDGKWKSLVTIEITKRHLIVQAKAKYNQHPSNQLMTFIQEWARREGLSMRI